VLDDDPGRVGLLRQPGHRFFFTPEEIEPLTSEPASASGAEASTNLSFGSLAPPGAPPSSEAVFG
jgi:hypothetical protein